MENFLLFRILTANELSILMVSIGIFVALFFGGRGILGSEVPSPILPLSCLTFIYFSYLLASVLFPGISTLFALILLFLLAAYGIWSNKELVKSDLQKIGISFLPLIPILWLALINEFPIWDDYTHWLPSAKYLFLNGHLPTNSEPILNHAQPDYPYARALIHAIVNSISGEFSTKTQGLFNVLMLSSILLWGPVVVEKSCQLKKDFHPFYSIFLFSLCLIFLVISLGPRLIISSYADPLLSMSMVHLFLLLWYFGPISNIKDLFSAKFFSYILVFCSLSFIKTYGLYYSIIITVPYLLFWLLKTKSKKELFDVIKINVLALIIIGLSIISLQGLWDFYTDYHEIKRSFAEIKELKLYKITSLLASMERQIIEKPYHFSGLIVMLVTLLFADYNRKQGNKILLVLPIMIFSGIFLFHLLAYLIFYGGTGTRTASSFGRYIGSTGLLIWTCITIYILQNLKMNSANFLKIFSITIGLIFFSLSIMNSNKFIGPKHYYDFEIEANNIIQNLNNENKILIVDMKSNGIDATIIRYHLDGKIEADYVSPLHYKKHLNQEIIDNWLKKYSFVYVYFLPNSVLPLLSKSKHAHSSRVVFGPRNK